MIWFTVHVLAVFIDAGFFGHFSKILFLINKNIKEKVEKNISARMLDTNNFA